MTIDECNQAIVRIQNEFATANPVQLQQLQVQYNQMLGFREGWNAREALDKQPETKDKNVKS